MSPKIVRKKEERRQQMCSFCANHKTSSPKKGHKLNCRYKSCNCPDCFLVKARQHDSAKEKRLQYRSSKDEDDTTNVNGKQRKVQKCRLCQNHGKSVPMRDHKRYCKYASCDCKPCKLTRSRRDCVTREAKLKRRGGKCWSEIKLEDVSMSPQSNYDAASEYSSSSQYSSDESRSPLRFPEIEEDFLPCIEDLLGNTQQQSQVYYQQLDDNFNSNCEYIDQILLGTQNVKQLPNLNGTFELLCLN